MSDVNSQSKSGLVFPELKNDRFIRALLRQPVDTTPVWMMRQAGRYLPEYRATRAQAGDFLSLRYNSDLAAEVTLQPIRRYGFDAAILFADILLLPQALGADLWFEAGEGPRLSTITTMAGVQALKPRDAIHETLAPIYETVRILARELPRETALIGFAGAPWTVATYMIEGRGSDRSGARTFAYQHPEKLTPCWRCWSKPPPATWSCRPRPAPRR